jgi:hypothetical protein
MIPAVCVETDSDRERAGSLAAPAQAKRRPGSRPRATRAGRRGLVARVG